jgi:hypothetical protein
MYSSQQLTKHSTHTYNITKNKPLYDKPLYVHSSPLDLSHLWGGDMTCHPVISSKLVWLPSLLPPGSTRHRCLRESRGNYVCTSPLFAPTKQMIEGKGRGAHHSLSLPGPIGPGWKRVKECVLSPLLDQ